MENGGGWNPNAYNRRKLQNLMAARRHKQVLNAQSKQLADQLYELAAKIQQIKFMKRQVNQRLNSAQKSLNNIQR